ncbi:UNVERIFIED_CONTAM: hypothetical protein FKN15_023825 [Acipenser sinensis]
MIRRGVRFVFALGEDVLGARGTETSSCGECKPYTTNDHSDIPYGLDSSPGAHQLLDMPLGTKLPANQCSSAMFYTTNLCEKIICTLKDFNEYRQYLTTIKLDFEKNYMREQEWKTKERSLLMKIEADVRREIRLEVRRKEAREERARKVSRQKHQSPLQPRHANKEIAVEKLKEASAVKICASDSSLADTKIGEEAGNILLQLSEKIYLDKSASLGKSFEQVFFECKTRAAEEILGISKSQIIKTAEQIVYDIIDDVESKVNRPAPIFSTTLELSSTVASLPQGTEPQLKPSIKISSGSLMSKTQVSLLASDIVDAVFENLLCAIGYDDIFAAKEKGVSGTEIHVPISTVESGALILPSRISYVTEDIIKTVSGKLNPLMAQSKGYLSKLSLKDVHQRKSKLTSYTKEAASAILQAIKMELDRESLQKTALGEKVKLSQLSFLASDFLAAVLENFKMESFADIGSKTKITALQKEKDEQIVSWGDSLLAKWVCQKKAPKSRIFTSSSPADTETGPEAGNISLQLSEKIYLDRSDVNLVTTQIVGSVLEQLKKMKSTVVDFVPTMAEIYLLSKYLVTTIAEGMLSWLDILAKLEACTKAKNRKNENPEDKKKTSPRINKELARTNSKSSIEEGEKQNVKVSRSVSFDFYSGDIYYYSKAKRLTKGGILGMPYGKSVKEPSSSEEASRTTSECSKTPVVEEPVKVQFPYNLTLMSAESRCPLPNSTKLNTQRPTALSKMSASVSKLFRP